MSKKNLKMLLTYWEFALTIFSVCNDCHFVKRSDGFKLACDAFLACNSIPAKYEANVTLLAIEKNPTTLAGYLHIVFNTNLERNIFGLLTSYLVCKKNKILFAKTLSEEISSSDTAVFYNQII
jgi:hypothetical protein